MAKAAVAVAVADQRMPRAQRVIHQAVVEATTHPARADQLMPRAQRVIHQAVVEIIKRAPARFCRWREFREGDQRGRAGMGTVSSCALTSTALPSTAAPSTTYADTPSPLTLSLPKLLSTFDDLHPSTQGG